LLLASLGAKHLVIMDESNWYPAGHAGVLDEAGWTGLTQMVREGQKLVEGEYGLKFSFHPHIGTAVEKERQIDRLLAETEIDLCFDTGHHAFWDQDPLAYMERVFPRIAYMQLKNVDGAVRQRVLDGHLSIADSYGAGVMCPLPEAWSISRRSCNCSLIAALPARSWSSRTWRKMPPKRRCSWLPGTSPM
jgi:inosose dehydratase